jgi:hypothetical protein
MQATFPAACMKCELIVNYNLTKVEEKLQRNVFLMTSFSLLVHSVTLMC